MKCSFTASETGQAYVCPVCMAVTADGDIKVNRPLKDLLQSLRTWQKKHLQAGSSKKGSGSSGGSGGVGPKVKISDIEPDVLTTIIEEVRNRPQVSPTFRNTVVVNVWCSMLGCQARKYSTLACVHECNQHHNEFLFDFLSCVANGSGNEFLYGCLCLSAHLLPLFSDSTGGDLPISSPPPIVGMPSPSGPIPVLVRPASTEGCVPFLYHFRSLPESPVRTISGTRYSLSFHPQFHFWVFILKLL